MNILPSISLTIATLAILGMAPLSLFAAEEDSLDNLFSLSLEELLQIDISIGTRSYGRDYFNSPVPVKVITAAEMEASGLGEFARVLERLVPAFNVSHVSIHDGDDHVRAFSLRGMGHDQVLVLINGKRMHHSALLHPFDPIGKGETGVDINTISMRAVERVEVLSDGAAAQYGSDAIAGVINIVLKSNVEKRVTTTGGKTDEGDGELFQVDINYGTELPNDGFFHFTAEVRDRADTNRAGLDNRQQYFDGDPRNNDPARVTFRHGDPDSQDLILMYNTQVEFNNDMPFSFYSFGGLNYRESEAGGYFRRPNDDRNVRAIYPDGFLPLIAVEILDLSLTAGAEWATGEDWNFNFSNSFGHNELQYNVENSLNTSFGTASPTDFDAGTLSSSQYLANLNIQTLFELAWNNPLSFGTGFEFRWENYQIEAGEPASYQNGGIAILDGPNAGDPAPVGSQVLPGFAPSNETDESRYNLAYYLDLENQITERFLGQVAARYEYYEDFGSDVTGKLAASYNPTDKWVLRSSLSTGLKAPSLGQSTFTSTFTELIGGVMKDISHLPVSDPTAQALGAEDLEPEKSIHFGFGTSYRPNDDLLFEVDFFHIEIDDRIVESGFIDQDVSRYGQQVVDILENAGLQAASFLTNAIDTKTQGVDLSARYKWNLNTSGTLNLSASYHYNDTKVEKVRAPSVLGANGMEVIFDSEQRTRIEDTQPKDKFILSSEYELKPLKLLIKFIRFGEATDTSSGTVYGAKWNMDFDVSYQFGKHFTVAGGGHNVFNEFPDYKTSSGLDGKDSIFRYPGRASFGINGAFYYLRLNYRL